MFFCIFLPSCHALAAQPCQYHVAAVNMRAQTVRRCHITSVASNLAISAAKNPQSFVHHSCLGTLQYDYRIICHYRKCKLAKAAIIKAYNYLGSFRVCQPS